MVGASSPATIDANVDEELVAPVEASVQCEGAATLDVCSAMALGVSRWGSSLAVFLTSRATARAETAMIEIVQQEGGGLVARAFVRVAPDADTGRPPVCESAFSVPRTISGTLTLSSFDLESPAAVHAHAVLSIDGTTVTIDL